MGIFTGIWLTSTNWCVGSWGFKAPTCGYHGVMVSIHGMNCRISECSAQGARAVKQTSFGWQSWNVAGELPTGLAVVAAVVVVAVAAVAAVAVVVNPCWSAGFCVKQNANYVWWKGWTGGYLCSELGHNPRPGLSNLAWAFGCLELEGRGNWLSQNGSKYRSLNGGFLKNRGTTKWMVYNGKCHSNGWFQGTPPILGNLQMVFFPGQSCWFGV